MRSRHLVDPELVPLLDGLPAFALTVEGLAELRRAMDAMPPFHAPEAPGVTREEVFTSGRAGAPPVRLLVYRPAGLHAGDRVPALLHIHGGGYVLWRPEHNDARNRHLAGDLRCVVVSVDYRLAPETPFPGPLEDCYSALLWLHANAPALGVDVARIAVQGESAGGGLAAALALLARDRREVRLAFQLLVYPMLDDRTGSPRHAANPFTGEYVWTAENNRFGWRAMLGREPGDDDVSPHCAPARAGDLSGLPPAFVQVGTLDLFLDEDIEYARRLVRAGVSVELNVQPGVFHGFDVLPGTRAGARFTRAAHEALRRAFAR